MYFGDEAEVDVAQAAAQIACKNGWRNFSFDYTATTVTVYKKEK